jgi:hypothetical protein
MSVASGIGDLHLIKHYRAILKLIKNKKRLLKSTLRSGNLQLLIFTGISPEMLMNLTVRD